VALFDLDIADDDVNAVTISSASDLTVAATVNDSFGPVIFATPEAGATTTLLLSGADDLHRLVVTGLSGSGAVDVAVAPVTPVQLDAEQATSHDVGDAGDRVVFALDPGEQIMAVDLVPSPGVSVDASVISQLGDVLIASDGPSSEPDTLVIDGRIGPVSIVANVAAGPGALRFEPHVVVPEDPLIGGTAFGEIASPGDLAAFELPMDDAVWLQVTVSAPVLDPVLLLFDPSGFPVSGAVGVDGTAQVTSGLFGEPGDYRVVVGGSGATGTFTLRSMESFSEDDFFASSGLDSPGLDDELLRVVAENLTS
jgi:hypothetical protein